MDRTQIVVVTGMSCAACAISVEKALNVLEGVQVQVNFADQTARIRFRENVVQPEHLRAAVQRAGYDLIWSTADEPLEETDIFQQKEYKRLKKQTLWSMAFTLPVIVLAMFFSVNVFTRGLMMLLSFLVLFFWGKNFFIKAWAGFCRLRFGMDALVALSTCMAFSYSLFNTLFPEFLARYQILPHVYFETTAVIITFILLGKTLESWARSKTSHAIRKLIGLQAKEVTILEQGREVSKPIESIQSGELIRVKSGEKIPVDGKVVSGSFYLDESMITGEPISVLRTVGDRIFAGTINQGGSFEMESEKVGAHTLLAGIIRAVRQAQSSKAPVQNFADRIAGIFVPIVISIAISTFFIWGFSPLENAWLMGFSAMFTVLIIACPCALGLAVPTALIAAIGRAAEDGILIKDAESLERVHRIDALILDKTGTLTQGKPKVKEIFWPDDVDPAGYAAILIALEKRSSHPLAQAVLAHFDRYPSLDQAPFFFKENPGKGVQGLLGGKKYRAGSLSWLDEAGVVFGESFSEKIDRWKRQGYTLVGFAQDRCLLAILSIVDPIKANASEVVAQLNNLGIETHMLTGDHPQAALAVAEQVGIRLYRASQLPADKMVFIEKLQGQGKLVAMVGDGINDAQALAQADLSFAIGQGSDVAIDAAGITLLSADLRKIPKALHLSAQMIRTIRQNLFWAFIYNVVGIPVAAGILYPFNGYLLNPMLAAAAMAMSSVSVVLNSLRLRRAVLGLNR
ncbi:MAG: heavy metal translocating P-type ATPase [Flavobacteriales bacterium AspAUS03]